MIPTCITIFWTNCYVWLMQEKRVILSISIQVSKSDIKNGMEKYAIKNFNVICVCFQKKRLTKQASMWPSLCPAQNISSCSSTLIFLCLCQIRHFSSDKIGTNAFCKMLVPVLPESKIIKFREAWNVFSYYL